MGHLNNWRTDLSSFGDRKNRITLLLVCALLFTSTISGFSQKLFPAMQVLSFKGETSIGKTLNINSDGFFEIIDRDLPRRGEWIIEGDEVGVGENSELIIIISEGYYMVVFENSRFKIITGNAISAEYPAQIIEIENFQGSIGLFSKKTPRTPKIKISNKDGVAIIKKLPGEDSPTKVFISTLKDGITQKYTKGTVVNVCEGYVDVIDAYGSPLRTGESVNLHMYEGKQLGERKRRISKSANERCKSFDNYKGLDFFAPRNDYAEENANYRWNLSGLKREKEKRTEEKKKKDNLDKWVEDVIKTNDRVLSSKETVTEAKKMSIPELEQKVGELQLEMKKIADSGATVNRQMKTNFKIYSMTLKKRKRSK